MTTNKERQQEAREDRAEAKAEEKREQKREDREAAREAEVKPQVAAVAPSVGRIVFYNGPEPAAAIITKVDGTTVNLAAFPSGACMKHYYGVAMGTEPGTWSWPPRV